MSDTATAHRNAFRDMQQELLLIASRVLDLANVAGGLADDKDDDDG